MKCRICQSKNLALIFVNEHSPKTSHKFLSKRDLVRDGTVTVSVLKCRGCGMVQLKDAYADDEYVDDYQRNIAFSKMAQGHITDMAGKLIEHGVSNMVEVGCGNGIFARQLKESGQGNVKITAFEPSVGAFKEAKKNGVNVHNIFFDRSLPKKYSGYDGFALRFVLEHLDNPNPVLGEIMRRCKPGAVGLIEVPNALKQFMYDRWYEFFPEHILYFTPATLTFSLERLGLEVLWLKETIRREFLAVLVRVPFKKGRLNPKDLPKKFRALAKGPTYLWGASGGATTLLNSLFAGSISPKDVPYIIDSDKNKWGLYASGSHAKIVPPSQIAKEPPDTIIIMAINYEDEIREQLKKLGFKGKVRSLREALPGTIEQ